MPMGSTKFKNSKIGLKNAAGIRNALMHGLIAPIKIDYGYNSFCFSTFVCIVMKKATRENR